MGKNKDIEHTLSKFNDDAALRKFLEATERIKVPSKKSKEAAWEQFVENISSQQRTISTTKTRTINFQRTIYYAAASVALLASSLLIFHSVNVKTIRAPYGKTISAILPDSSSVTLNAGSQIKYKKLSWHNNRIVNLKGEAFFNVTKGTAFSVSSNSNIVTVLGTSFNVYYRNSEYKVQCFTGKVKVDIPETKPVILDKGESLKSVEHTIIEKKVSFNSEQASGWMRGEFYFQKEPLTNVFSELERQLKIEIKAANIDNRVYTGFFRNNNLNEALESVCLPMNLKYNIDNNIVTIQ